MTETRHERNVPKAVGAVMVALPGLALRLLMSYGRLKRSSRKASEAFVQGLERDGVPPHLARRLGESYRSDLSIRRLVAGRNSHVLDRIRPL